MVGLFLAFAVVVFSLAVLLWAGTLGLQGLIYNDPATSLHWRAPAAAGALTLFIVTWCLLDYRWIEPGQPEFPLDTFFRFQPTRTEKVDKLWSVTKGQETLFKKRESGQVGVGPEYYDDRGNPWRRSDTNGLVEAIIIEENGQKSTFKPKLDKDGNFPTVSETFPGYFEVKGRRSMEQLGQVSQFRYGLWFLNMLFNAVHLALWFVVIWLLLRFQWTHALGLAICLWLVMSVVMMPWLLNRTRDAAYPPPVPRVLAPVGNLVVG